jgi:hypothetical protein
MNINESACKMGENDFFLVWGPVQTANLTLSLNKGMYVVKQITEGGQITTKNILIQD